MSLRVRLKSIKCVREINEESASEEAYVLVTAVRLNRTLLDIDTFNLRVFRYGVWDNFDEGEVANIFEPPFWGLNSVPDELTNVGDVIFIISLMENDNGDPDAYRQYVEAAASASLGATIGETNRAVRADRLILSIRDALNGLNLPIPFALDDDHIGTEILRLNNSDLVPFGAVDKPLTIQSGEGHYELIFEVARIRVAASTQDVWEPVVIGNRLLVITSNGKVFVHEITGNLIGVHFQLGGPPVAANRPPDKWVRAMDNRILVILNDGRVFAHKLSGNTIENAILLNPNGPPVAANAPDRWVRVMDNRILVILNDGRVFAHRVSGNTIENATLLNPNGPLVAANAPDRWVVTMGNRILVILDNGQVFAHEVTQTEVRHATQLGGPPVAANRPPDKWVVTMGNRLLVILDDGRVFAHDVTQDSVGPAFQLS
ncbi:MAG TPA: hypothetical protein VEX70_14860 [Pyrinomonadaceae bacterium]|nr:hypothetical protein [Pyrinomonadaceae bacterium]